MRNPAFRASMCLVAAAAPACAQPGFANFSTYWTEVNATTHLPIPNPNGVLEPGEAARIGIAVEFSPIGTPVGTSTVAGFASAGFGLNQLPGTWSDRQVPPGFFGLPLTPLNPQRVWQPLPLLGSSPIATNPIPMLWSAVWLPTTYLPQTAHVSLNTENDDYPTLFKQIGTDPQGNPLFGTMVPMFDWGAPTLIPVAPSPSIPSAVLLTYAFAARRRRPAPDSQT